MSVQRAAGRTTRPLVMGTHYMVSAGHYLAALTAARILERGGNAIDAGVAAGLCINVVQPDMTNIGGVAPICIYRSSTDSAETISGLGSWPMAVDANVFRERYGGRIAPGIHRCVVPAAIDAWLTALERHGTMSFSDVAESAIDLAANGFVMYDAMYSSLSQEGAFRAVRSWTSTREVFLRGDSLIPVGDLVVQTDLARTLSSLAVTERGAGSREEGIRAIRDRFYRGDIAEAMVQFSRDCGGWLSLDDLATFKVEIEVPLKTEYRGYEIFSCGAWCQGPVVLETMNILEGYDLANMGVGTVETFHVVLESLKAAFADRDRYYGDPRHVDVPIEGLLSKDYAATWRTRIRHDRASEGMPEPGDAWRFSPGREQGVTAWQYPLRVESAPEPDTSYVCVVDGAGNAFSATPSDGITGTPIVSGLGFIISGRGAQSWLNPDHPSSLRPGKRPRLTPSPGLVRKGRGLVMPYGTPGGDVQPQAMVQFLTCVIDFGMDLQAAVEAPRCATFSFPASADPHRYEPGLVAIEGRAETAIISGLRSLGHAVQVWPDWTDSAGSVCAIRVDSERGVLHAAADPRHMAYAIGR